MTEPIARGWDRFGLEVLRSPDFDDQRLRRDGIYAVCFGATWCLPTRRFAPKFVARAPEFPGQFAFADITAMDEPLWDTFEIKITPTMVVFRDGVAVGRFDGRRVLGLREADLDRLTEMLGALTRAGTARPTDPSTE
jgi:hypothetical protein